MSIVQKTKGRKLKLAKAARTSSPVPRWVDIRVFGMGKARFRAVRRFKSRHWKRSKRLKV